MRDKDVDLNKLIKVFNTEGKKAAIELSEQEYATKYSSIQRRIKEETNYFYNRSTRKYELKKEENPEFLTLEELYHEKPETINKSNEDGSNLDLNPHLDNAVFKEMIVDLMKDKMQEMSKFIHLEQSTKRVLINIKKLKADGYRVILD